MEDWVVGMRKPDPGRAPNWPRLLYWRLTGQHFLTVNRASVTTRSLEQERGEEPSIYFFLGRCEPHYGYFGISNDPPRSEFLVSPFDTGGIVSGKIATDPPLAKSQRIRLVENWTFDPTSFRRKFCDWGIGAYRSSSHYSLGERPDFHLVREVEVASASANNSHAWDWEARLSATPTACSQVRPSCLVVDQAQLRLYRTWLHAQGILSVPEYTGHMNFVMSILRDPGTRAAADVLNEYLAERGQW